MKNSITLVSIFTFFLLSNALFAQTMIPAEALQQDFMILKKGFKTLHPGLYRYADSLTMEGYFIELQQSLNRDLTRAEAYLAFSGFTAKIKCGHTYCNFWNQPEEIQKELFQKEDKLPFTFQIIDRRMLVMKNASNDERLTHGVEILTIDGVPVAQILDTLARLVKSDGSNDAKRYKDLEVWQTNVYESFDVYQPLIFPPKNGQFQLEAVDLKTGERFSASVSPMNRGQRYELLKKRFVGMVEKADDTWEFKILDAQTGYLRMGSFETWHFEMDYKKFLANAFKQLKDKEIPNLVIDIRGNEGGMDDVILELAKYLVTKPSKLPASRSYLKFETVPDDLRPYLNTWDPSFYDFSGKLKPAGNGYFISKKENSEQETFQPGRKAYNGKVWLLMGPANSSATFIMSRILKENGLATLVGQQTGGNMRGINGGAMFFLTLPNSKVEMDIPIYGVYYEGEQPDAGLMPDIYVEPNVEDIVNEVDTELEAVKRLIAEHQ